MSLHPEHQGARFLLRLECLCFSDEGGAHRFAAFAYRKADILSDTDKSLIIQNK
jgi:hypothetical protein